MFGFDFRQGQGDDVLPVKDNQKNLRENIQTAFDEPVFPLVSFESDCEKTHGRIERRSIEVLPAIAAGIEKDWPSVQHICRVTRFRQLEPHWQRELGHAKPSPQFRADCGALRYGSCKPVGQNHRHEMH